MGFYQKIRNDVTDGWDWKIYKKKPKKLSIMSLLFLHLYSHAFKRSNLGHRKHSIRLVVFKTIIRIIWKVNVDVICFTVSSSDNCSEWIQAILSTMTVAEWHVACGIPCTELWSKITFSKDWYKILIRNYHPKFVISLDTPAVPSQSAAFHNIWRWARSMCCRRFVDGWGKAIPLGFLLFFVNKL